MTEYELADLKRFRALMKMCGYLENDTDTVVKISADDATRTWHVSVGDHRYYSSSIRGALDEAIKGEK